MSEHWCEPKAKLSQYQTIIDRLDTFKDCALNTETKNECTRAGFILIRKKILLCVYCEISVSPEEIKESAFTVHARKSPNCSYLKFYAKKTLNENVKLKNKSYDTFISQRANKSSECDSSETTLAYQSAIFLGYSKEIVKQGLQLLKEQRQSLSTNVLLDSIFSIEASIKRPLSHTKKDLQSGRQTDDVTPIVKPKVKENNSNKPFKPQIGYEQTRGNNNQSSNEINDESSTIQSNSSAIHQRDNVDGYTNELSFQRYITNDARPKAGSYTSLPLFPKALGTERSGELSTSTRHLKSSENTSSDLEQFEEELFLGLKEDTDYQLSPADGQQNSNALQPRHVPQLPILTLQDRNTLRSIEEDLGLSEIKGEGETHELFKKSATSDNKLDSSANDTTSQSEYLDQATTTLNHNSPFLSIPPTNQPARRERSPTLSGSSGYQSMISTAGSSNGRTRALFGQHNDHETIRGAGQASATADRTAVIKSHAQLHTDKETTNRLQENQSGHSTHKNDSISANGNPLDHVAKCKQDDSGKSKVGLKKFSDSKQTNDTNASTGDQVQVASAKTETATNDKRVKTKTKKKKQDNSQTRAEYETLFMKQMCNACWKKTADCLYLPCRHLNRCEECSDKLETCPKCEDEIIATVKVYFS